MQEPIKPSQKKKKTIVIKFSPLYDTTLFQGRKSTPLAIVKENSTKIQNESGWLKCTEFPNPCAYHMAAEYKILAPIMGELASTITEYMDKETGQPVLMLFPTTDVYIFDSFEENYMSRLNHASRRNFYYRVNKLSPLIDKALMVQLQHQKVK